METQSTVSITNTTKGKLPRLPFSQIKDTLLGKKYELSIVIVGDKKMRALNRTHRDKDTTTDILSFPLSDISGEIFIELKTTRTKAREFGKTFEHYLGFLFIHGLLHLKGLDHGHTMEAEEKKWCKKFGF